MVNKNQIHFKLKLTDFEIKLKKLPNINFQSMKLPDFKIR